MIIINTFAPDRHCEEAVGRRGNLPYYLGDCFASLAVTVLPFRSPCCSGSWCVNLNGSANSLYLPLTLLYDIQYNLPHGN